MTRLDIRLLGGFQACLGGAPPLVLAAKAQALLAYLALLPGTGHPRDKIAALLWGATSDAQARANLRHTVFTLRKALGDSVLHTEGHTLAVEASAVDVDASTFERLVDDGTPAALERAGEIYGGDLLDGLVVDEPTFEEWLLAERERLRERAVEALTKLLAHQMREPATERAIQTTMRLLALEPLQEAVHRTLMRLYARQGRRAAALKQYQVCVAVLQRELGAEPEIETRQLYLDVLQHRAVKTEQAGAPSARRARSAGSPVAPPALPVAAEPRPETVLVGRDPELRRLRDALDDAARGRGRVVMVIGEAGIGKTSLLEPLAAEADRRGSRILLGRCYESEQILPFGPWVDAFRSGRGVVDDDALHDLLPVWRAELSRLLPELADPGVTPPDTDQRRLFESVGRLIECLAVRQPLVLLLEDLHWADEMSLRLLSFLGRRLQAWPVLAMATAREEELAEAAILRRAWQELRGESHVTEMRLAPLSAPDTASLVRSLTKAGRAPDAVARLEERIWRVSEGNPFVVVETLRALDEGTAFASTSLPLADRVREVVAGRLEKLSDQGRQLAAVAAVIGRDFDFALLVRASRLADSDVAAGVEELVRRHVLHGVGEGFEFTHDRIREVAYDQILPQRRTLLHGHVASALEEMHATDLAPYAAALGRHCQQAEKWDKAADYLHQAGVRANGRLAYREATTLLEAARAALAHLPESADTLARSIDLRFDLRNALQPRAEFERVRTELQEAEKIAARLGDRRRGGQALVYLTNHSFYTGKFALAVDYGRRAAQLGDELGDLGTRVVASNYLAQAHALLGEYAAAIELARRSITLHTGDLMRDRFGQAMLPAVTPRLIIGRCLADLGDVSEAVRSTKEGLELARAADHPLSVVFASGGFGNAHLRVGRFTEAIGVLERGVALVAELGLYFNYGQLAGPLGACYTATGRTVEGAALLEAAVEDQARLGLFAFHPLNLNLLAESYVASDRDADALRTAQQALAAAREQGARGEEARTYRVFGEILSRPFHFDPGASEFQFRSGLALADELGMRPLIADLHLGLGELHANIDKRLEARAELTAAADLYRATELTYRLPRVEAALARIAE